MSNMSIMSNGNGPVLCESPNNNVLNKLPEQWNRRALRKAVRNSDISKIRTIINKGCDVNAVVSDVYQDTALTWSVKNGLLEVVEYLVHVPGCDLDLKDRNHHTALDEAIKRWLGATTVVKHSSTNGDIVLQDYVSEDIVCDTNDNKRDLNCNENTIQYSQLLKLHLGARYRILKCLLEAKASVVSSTYLDMAAFQALSESVGKSFLFKLAKVVGEKGHPHVKGVLCSVLMTYRNTHDCIRCLLEAGADPCYYLTKEPCRPFMPTENALLLLRVCNDNALLARIECDTTGHLTHLEDHQIDQLLMVLRLLVVCGHSLQLYVMNFLHEHRYNFYMWVVRQGKSPAPLQCLARIKIRQMLKPNVLHCYNAITSLPAELKQFLLLSEWLIPKKLANSETRPVGC